MEEFVEVICCA